MNKNLLCITILFVGILSSGCESEQNPVSQQPEPTKVQITDLKITPLVAHEGETFTVEVKIEGTSSPVIYAALGMSPNGVLRRNGELLRDLVLYDDGSNGDREAGDGWYTMDNLEVPVAENGISAYSLTRLTGLRTSLIGTPLTDEVFFVSIPFRKIDPTIIPVPPVTDISDDVRATSHVVSMVASQPLDFSLLNAETIVRRYYEYFPDDRDFIVLDYHLLIEEFGGARAIQIRNDVDGIGLDVRDFRNWGSPSRLSLVLQFSNPFRSTAVGFCLMAHELTHRWMAYLGSPLADNTSHWVPDVFDRPTTSFDPTGNCIMNDLELYLAGFLPPDSIATPFTANGYDIDDLIRDNGTRLPAYPEAQTEFNIAFIVVGERTLEDHEFAYFHHLASEYIAPTSRLGITWQETTGGRSVLIGDIPLP
jgi:hypothetical protein